MRTGSLTPLTDGNRGCGDGADDSGSGGIGSVVYFGGSAGEDAGAVGAVDIDSTAIG